MGSNYRLLQHMWTIWPGCCPTCDS